MIRLPDGKKLNRHIHVKKKKQITDIFFALICSFLVERKKSYFDNIPTTEPPMKTTLTKARFYLANQKACKIEDVHL